MFSGTSKLRRPQATHLKSAENVDILIQIICAKVNNDRTKDNRCTECTEIENIFFLFQWKISAVCISLLCYSTMSKLPGILAITYTGNNIYWQ